MNSNMKFSETWVDEKSIEKNVETQNLASPDVRSFLISQAKRRKILRLYLDDIEQQTFR